MTNKRFVLLIFIILFAVIGLVFYFFFFKSAKSVDAADISGKVLFSALKPDPDDKGSLIIKARKYNTNDSFEDAVAINLENNSPFVWKKADSGQAYELNANLVIDGKVVKQSDPIIVTAPAIDQLIPIKVTWHDLPADVVKDEDSDISGKVNVQGFIPSGSTVQVFTKEGTNSYESIYTTIASPGMDWQWTKAIPLKDYKIKAVLYSGDKAVGTSSESDAIAGESEVHLTIKSGIKDPSSEPASTNPPAVSNPQGNIQRSQIPSASQKKAKISGRVQINGPKDRRSSLLMLWRHPGENDYKVIQRIDNPTAPYQDWSWDVNADGKDLEITAALQVNGNNTATTRSIRVVAPAQNVNFTLNTGVHVNGTSSTPEKESCNVANNDEYDVTIKWPLEKNAGNYWLEIGENPGWNNNSNQKQRADGNNQKRTTVRIRKDKNYYAQYAYSYCVECNADQNFSTFSSPFRFYCGSDPGSNISSDSDWKGYTCNTNTHICELTKDTNAPYSFNNSGLTQCQQACN